MPAYVHAITLHWAARLGDRMMPERPPDAADAGTEAAAVAAACAAAVALQQPAAVAALGHRH